VEFEVVAGAEKLPYRFISAAVLAELTPADWILLSAIDSAVLDPVDVALDPPFAPDALSGLETAAAAELGVPGVVGVVGARLVSVWLIEMS
jgi:hypothetical protein